MELARVEGGGWLPGGANGTRGGVAELVDRSNVGAVEKVEGIGDEIEAEAFAEADAFGNAEIELEESRRRIRVASEGSEAAKRGHGRNERLLGIGQANARKPEAGARDEG